MASTHREIAGSVAPIISVGGRSTIAATSPRRKTLNWPVPAMAVYTLPSRGTISRISTPQMPMPISRYAYTFNGWCFASTFFGKSQLPRHIPPMNVPSSTPNETADDPSDNWSIWNQTTS